MGYPVAMFEITSPDQERASKFYAQLFGWGVQSSPGMDDYALVDTDAGPDAIGGGIGPAQSGGSGGVKIYVRVPDLEESLARAEELGGARLVPPTELPGDFGSFAILTDPDGNQVGLWA